MFGFVIQNGLVVDGSGAPGFVADVGVTGERVTAVGNLAGAEAAAVIDATGQVVAPGFIDIHTHSDLTLLAEPYGMSKVRQGVTSEVCGNCGYSPFPISAASGSLLRARVVYLQPKAERWRESSVHIHILCLDWIEPYWHVAIYHAGDVSYSGKFLPHRYRLHDKRDWRFEGTFERDE